MRLDLLLDAANLPGAGVAVLDVRGDARRVEVIDIVGDSRRVTPGALYCCVTGQRFDGHLFAAEAVAAGAVALVCEHPLAPPVPQIVVASTRAALGPLADALLGHPSASLRVAGVTGTNGKTTTVALLAAIFEAHGWPTATIGTLTGTRTTPEAPLLQAKLAELREEGVTAVAMEVSSHALDQHRVDAVHFAAATFTNLTQDHLDYHGTMDAYFSAKAKLFEPGRADVAIVNDDDPWGRRLLRILAGRGSRAVPFSLADADDLRIGPRGSTFCWQNEEITLRLGGRFNVYNALAAATTAREMGVTAASVASGLAAVASVPGRFEPVDAGQPFLVLVDYAHTPDGLEQALTAARELAGRNLLVVFGAGGDRDRAKRPLMGAAATRLADLAVLTSDNPRSEEPDQIIEEVQAGARGPGALVIEPDRSRAIASALAAAEAGDVVVIAGKGHETGQELRGRIIPFNDADVARAALGRILRSRGDTERS
ncbi:MAG TPA: UDP-N-acetylmuramoyl-L-alanyl-D-glutamate--2,6-diaminopimelate ligase [Acidimicrobiales bacterium]|nr:UDP-N-acetylmuramoyl-L-alanyl-D-glutamate--2,6-diaminopimelate ligase [Acidimicrobiales bacterium]